jgi:nitrogen fixation protein FixH
MKPGSWWPLIIAGALALHVISSLVVVYVATSDPSYAVEDDYYQKAVAWDEKRAQDRLNQDLGWSLEFTVTPPEKPGDLPALELSLLDAAGDPLVGAVVSVEAFHNSRGDDIVREVLNEVGDGVYGASPPMRRNGRWELRFTVDHGGDHFTYTEARHLFVEGSWK